ncbi:sensor histidine kinase [Rhodospirillaceae bacterium SYSU D60014]|uniref:sensor histidine kinase n=1 Tax=Virgifigura deserti TaxID=2268457 RepID=UPI0013C4538C
MERKRNADRPSAQVTSVSAGSAIRQVNGERRRTDRVRALERELEVHKILLRELQHRAKNSLQLIAGLLSLQRSQVSDPTARAQLAEVGSHVLALANVYRHLDGTNIDRMVAFDHYLHDLCADLERSLTAIHRPRTITVVADPVTLTLERVLPLALITNELITNAFKYAHPDSTSDEQITVMLRAAAGGSVTLTVADGGIGLPDHFDPHRSGKLGMKVVTSLVQQLGGTLSFERLAPGTRFSVTLGTPGHCAE